MQTKTHPFEAAGLGKAPFRFVGYSYSVGPIDLGNGLSVGAPGQPMGCCRYCSQGIANLFHVRSADGKEFVVGCDCIRKVGADFANPKEFERERKRVEREARAAAATRRIEAAKARLEDPRVVERLAATPHPFGFEGRTALGYVDYLLAFGGTSGQIRAARLVEAAVDALAKEGEA